MESFTRALMEGDAAQPPLVVYGHCFEQFGASEPYMPVWEAIGQLARHARSTEALLLRARHESVHRAPASLGIQMRTPATAIDRRTDRMLREMCEAIESAADVPLVIVLEDLHWADHSTIDLLSALAGRKAAAKLLIIATYRPAENASTAEHPLRALLGRLLTTSGCRELSLGHLDEAAVERYLAERFPGSRFPVELTHRLHQRTGGWPLFLAQLVADLIEQGALTNVNGFWQLAGAGTEVDPNEPEVPAWLAVLDTQIPPTLRAMIESHVERLDSHTRHVLEAAAVAGVEFSAAAAAAAAQIDVVEAERVCQELARRYRFLEPVGCDEWPDGMVSAHYRFVHALYHNVVYEQVPAARRVRLHQLLGLALEVAWGGRCADEAANLAMHFEAARNWPRAAKYLWGAAQAVLRQHAHREAVRYLRRALHAIERLGPAEREAHELDVLSGLSVNLQVTRGFASPEVEQLHARAHALCGARPRTGDDVGKIFPVVWGIWLYHKVRSNLRQASDMCDELLALAEGNPSLMLQAHQAVCVTNLCLGNPQVTCDHMARAAAIYDPVRHGSNAEVFGQDPGVATLAFGAVALWLRGLTDEAVRASERSLALADRLRQPSSRALAMHFAAMLHQLLGDAVRCAHWADQCIRLADQEGFSFWRAGGRVLRGWARAVGAADAGSDAESGIDQIRGGIDAWLATGSRTYHSYFLALLTDALQRTGRAIEATQPLDEALAAARTNSEGLYEAELYRLKGRQSVLLNPGGRAEAKRCYTKAATLARCQGAIAFERRASGELVRMRGRTEVPAAVRHRRNSRAMELV